MQSKIVFSANLICLISTYLAIGVFNVNGDFKSNEVYSLKNDPIIMEITALLDNMLRLDSSLYNVHERLHLQTDLISSLRTEILNTKAPPDQCNIIKLFNKIEFQLNGINQNLIRQMNNNNDQNLDLMEPILFKMNSLRGCKADNNTQRLQEIKKELLSIQTKLSEFIKRLEKLERNLEHFFNPDQKNIKALVSFVENIDMQLNIQAERLHVFNGHLSSLQKVTNMEASEQSKC